MQFVIVLTGALLFVFYQFEGPAPIKFWQKYDLKSLLYVGQSAEFKISLGKKSG
jgi:hypothetical protein